MTGLKDVWNNRLAILEGITNSIFPRKVVEEIAKKRLSICKTCSYHSTNAKSKGYKTSRIDDHCTYCSCPLHTKTRALSASCPTNKWSAVITDKEQDKLDLLNKNDNDNKEHSTEGSV